MCVGFCLAKAGFSLLRLNFGKPLLARRARISENPRLRVGLGWGNSDTCAPFISRVFSPRAADRSSERTQPRSFDAVGSTQQNVWDGTRAQHWDEKTRARHWRGSQENTACIHRLASASAPPQAARRARTTGSRVSCRPSGDWGRRFSTYSPCRCGSICRRRRKTSWRFSRGCRRS